MPIQSYSDDSDSDSSGESEDTRPSKKNMSWSQRRAAMAEQAASEDDDFLFSERTQALNIPRLGALVSQIEDKKLEDKKLEDKKQSKNAKKTTGSKPFNTKTSSFKKRSNFHSSETTPEDAVDHGHHEDSHSFQGRGYSKPQQHHHPDGFSRSTGIDADVNTGLDAGHHTAEVLDPETRAALFKELKASMEAGPLHQTSNQTSNSTKTPGSETLGSEVSMGETPLPEPSRTRRRSALLEDQPEPASTYKAYKAIPSQRSARAELTEEELADRYSEDGTSRTKAYPQKDFTKKTSSFSKPKKSGFGAKKDPLKKFLASEKAKQKEVKKYPSYGKKYGQKYGQKPASSASEDQNELDEDGSTSSESTSSKGTYPQKEPAARKTTREPSSIMFGSAARMASAKDWPAQAMIDRLVEKFSDWPDAKELAERTVAKLIEMKAVDDVRFARGFIRARASRKSIKTLLNELKFKKVSESDAKAALDELIEQGDVTDDSDSMIQLWRRKFGQLPTNDKERNKQARYLASRGFSPGAVYSLWKSITKGDIPLEEE